LEAKNKYLEEEVEKGKSELIQCEKTIKRLQNDHTEEKYGFLDEIDQKNSELQSLSETLEEYTKRMQYDDQEMAALQEQLKESDAKVKQLESRSTFFQDQNTRLLEGKVQKYKSFCEKAKMELGKRTEKIETLQERLQSSETCRKQLDEKCSQLVVQNNGLKKHCEVLQKQIVVLPTLNKQNPIEKNAL